MTRRIALFALVSALAFAPAAAQAAPILFDLEGEAAGVGLTSLPLTSGGVTMTITREGGATFGVLDHLGGFPPEFGDRSLTPFPNTDDGAFLANLSQPTYFFGLDYGDLPIGTDVDSMTIEAYTDPDQVGLITSLTRSFGEEFPAFDTITIGGPTPARSLRFIGSGSGGFFSLYVDNIRLDTAPPIPEPASLLLLATGVAGCAMRLRRRG
jgi:hypothetical protein